MLAFSAMSGQPRTLVEKIWVRHDYTTLTPGMLSDHLAAVHCIADGARHATS